MERAASKVGIEQARASNRSEPLGGEGTWKIFYPFSLPLCHFLDDEGDLDISPILGDTAILDNRRLTY